MKNNAEYAALVRAASPRSAVGRNCVWAFGVGGAICLVGEGLRQWFLAQGFTLSDAGLLASTMLIFLSAAATVLGLYPKLARHAGAGTLVPITGFANAVVSPAVEFRCEGFITGVGSKMFIIAGPVIVYGTLAGLVWGVIWYFIRPYVGG